MLGLRNRLNFPQSLLWVGSPIEEAKTDGISLGMGSTGASDFFEAWVGSPGYLKRQRTPSQRRMVMRRHRIGPMQHGLELGTPALQAFAFSSMPPPPAEKTSKIACKPKLSGDLCFLLDGDSRHKMHLLHGPTLKMSSVKTPPHVLLKRLMFHLILIIIIGHHGTLK